MTYINIAYCVTKLLTRANDFCCLCLKEVKEKAVHFEDELGSLTNIGNMDNIFQMLSYILGDQFTDNISTLTNSVCEDCTRNLLECYKFMKVCRKNFDLLENVVNTLDNCFEHSMEDLKGFKSLFVSVNTHDLTSQQYYDNTKLHIGNKTTAIKRFQSITSKNYMNPKKKSHTYSDETFRICDVIQEKDTPTKFKCKVCSGVFSKSFNFKKHYYSQHSPKVLKCSECPRSYGSEALLKQHKYDCHNSMVCSECGKEYSNRYSLLYHMRRHSGEQPYECKHCGLKFQWSSRRAEHIRRYHMEPAVKCNICQMKFRALGSLYNHRKRHFNPNSRLNILSEEVTVEKV